MKRQPHHNGNQPVVQPILPKIGKIAMYARVAPEAQRTLQRQMDTLIELAHQRGYTDEQIIVFEELPV